MAQKICGDSRSETPSTSVSQQMDATGRRVSGRPDRKRRSSVILSDLGGRRLAPPRAAAGTCA